MNRINYLFLVLLILEVSLKSQNGFHPSYDKNSTSAVLVAHGLVDDETQAYNYLKQSINGFQKKFPQSKLYLHNLETDSLSTVRFDDAGSGIRKFFLARHSSFGQKNEVDRIKATYDTHLQKMKSVTVHGISRGAAAVINFIATHNPENITTLILECPFDSVNGCIEKQWRSKTMQSLVKRFVQLVFSRYCNNGQHPIDQIKNINNKDIAILIVCSEEDKIVHWKSSASLYNAFIQNGFTNVTFIKTKRGSHAKILWGPEGDAYYNAVHDLKKE